MGQETTFTLTASCPILELFDGTLDLNIWDADFKDMNSFVTVGAIILVTAEWEANLPGLAESYLGSSRLWWAILMFNGLDDSIHGVRVGIKLRIPDRDSLLGYFTNRRALTRGTNYLPNLSTQIV
jgi:hypothetical protein